MAWAYRQRPRLQRHVQVSLRRNDQTGLDEAACPFCGAVSAVKWPEHEPGFGALTAGCDHEDYHMVVDGGPGNPTLIFAGWVEQEAQP